MGLLFFVKCSVARIPRVKMSKEDTLKGQAIVNIPASAPCILIILIDPMLFLFAIGKYRSPRFLNNKLAREQKTCIIKEGDAS